MCCELLLQHAADPHLQGGESNSWLHVAARQSYHPLCEAKIAIVKRVLRARADPFRHDRHGRTALQAAEENRIHVIASVLRDAMRNPQT